MWKRNPCGPLLQNYLVRQEGKAKIPILDFTGVALPRHFINFTLHFPMSTECPTRAYQRGAFPAAGNGALGLRDLGALSAKSPSAWNMPFSHSEVPGCRTTHCILDPSATSTFGSNRTLLYRPPPNLNQVPTTAHIPNENAAQSILDMGLLSTICNCLCIPIPHRVLGT